MLGPAHEGVGQVIGGPLLAGAVLALAQHVEEQVHGFVETGLLELLGIQGLDDGQ
jgi:hypothetical protein